MSESENSPEKFATRYCCELGLSGTLLNVTYLSETTQNELKEAKAIVFGPNYRVIVSLPVKIGRKTRNVFFVVDTGSPVTYICEEVYEKFNCLSFAPNNLLNS